MRRRRSLKVDRGGSSANPPSLRDGDCRQFDHCVDRRIQNLEDLIGDATLLGENNRLLLFGQLTEEFEGSSGPRGGGLHGHVVKQERAIFLVGR